MSKKPTPKRTPKKAATKKTTRKKTAGMKPIGQTIQEVADGIQAAARDGLKPTVERGEKVDVVNGRWKTTTSDQIKTLSRRYQSASDTAKDASGAKGELLKKAEETQHLDVWAFREAFKFKKLGDELLCRRLPVFLKYLEDLGVIDRATAQADLLDAANAAAASANPDDEGDGQTDIEDAIGEDAKDEAAAAATGLAPSRRHRMRIVPKPSGEGEPTPAAEAPPEPGPEPEAAAG